MVRRAVETPLASRVAGATPAEEVAASTLPAANRTWAVSAKKDPAEIRALTVEIPAATVDVRRAVYVPSPTSTTGPRVPAAACACTSSPVATAASAASFGGIMIRY